MLVSEVPLYRLHGILQPVMPVCRDLQTHSSTIRTTPRSSHRTRDPATSHSRCTTANAAHCNLQGYLIRNRPTPGSDERPRLRALWCSEGSRCSLCEVPLYLEDHRNLKMRPSGRDILRSPLMYFVKSRCGIRLSVRSLIDGSASLPPVLQVPILHYEINHG